MSDNEKREIDQLPSKYRPLTAWAYFGYNILFSIPFVGFICLIVFACSSSNINRRSYARSFFCVFVVVGILFAAVALLSGGAAGISALLDKLKTLLPTSA